MPRNTGGIVITSTDTGPDQALAAFTGTWKPHICPAAASEGTIVLQLLPPAGDDPDRTDVWLWITRRQRWLLLGCWKDSGPGWTYRVAPLIHAAMAPPRPSPRAGAPTPKRGIQPTGRS